METLVNNAKTGDKVAFRALYEELSNPVFLFVRARTKSRDDAIDVLQEVFVDFWKSLDRFEFLSEKELRAYLYTIASRKLFKLYKFKRVTVAFEEVEDFLVQPANEDLRLEVISIQETIKTLHKKDREILELRHFAGLPFGEIALLLKSTENAMKVRHHRALRKLKSLLNYEE